MQGLSKKSWLRLGLFNLCLVAFVGMTMRYKILFEFPFFNQRFLLHTHSYFALTGWIGHILFVLIGSWLADIRSRDFRRMKGYQILILLSLLLSYGMMIAYTFLGYHTLTNSFSFAIVTLNSIFAIRFFRDTTKVKHPSLKWFKAGFAFYILSSLGMMLLAYMMAKNQLNPKMYLLFTYFYLHFQYNGWFFFSCVGLFIAWLQRREPEKYFGGKDGYSMFLIACIPTFLLSALWLNLPLWLIFVVAATALMQLLGFYYLVKRIYSSPALRTNHISKITRVLLVFIGIALGIKLLLQTGSTIPELSKLAFGFRNIVIAYLHLVLLCIISLFLLVYFRIDNIFSRGKTFSYAILAFAIFAYLNEIMLAIQGIASFSYVPIPGGNHVLLFVSTGLFLSAVSILLSTIDKTDKSQLKH